MKLTTKDIELFKALSRSDLGTSLVDYLKRLSDNICDSRQWKEDDTKESTTKAAEYIQRNLIDKVRTPPKEVQAMDNPYE